MPETPNTHTPASDALRATTCIERHGPAFFKERARKGGLALKGKKAETDPDYYKRLSDAGNGVQEPTRRRLCSARGKSYAAQLADWKAHQERCKAMSAAGNAAKRQKWLGRPPSLKAPVCDEEAVTSEVTVTTDGGIQFIAVNGEVKAVWARAGYRRPERKECEKVLEFWRGRGAGLDSETLK